MLKHNIAFDLTLDCPGCGMSDVCDASCDCPACYLPSRLFEDQRESVVLAYHRFAPVMSALNAEGTYWSWSTEDVSGGDIACSLEIEYGDGAWYEIHLQPGGYLVSHFSKTHGSRETNTPPEVHLLDEIIAFTADEVVSAMALTVGKE
jgi:hypothetical protein